MDKDVVIIGGGPVGMYLALNITKYFKKITILEKRPKFTRNQMVILNNQFLRNADFVGEHLPYTKLVRNIVLELHKSGSCYHSTPTLSLDFTCYTNPANIISTPVKVLEEILYKIVKKNKKITYIRPINDVKINDKDNLIEYKKNGKKHKIEYNVLFGTDGKNSIIQKKFPKYFKEKIIIPPKGKKMFGAVLIFKTKKSNLNINIENQAPELLTRALLPDKRRFPHARARVFQHQSGLIYMGIAITKKELDAIQKSKNKVPKELYDTVKSYMKLGDINVDVNKDLISISTFPIVVSIITNPIKVDKNDTIYMLIGDAFFNTHFFIGSALSSHFDGIHNMDLLLELPEYSEKGETLIDKFKRSNKGILGRFQGLIQNIFDTPRFSLDVEKISKKCKNISKSTLVKRGLKYGLNKEMMELFSKEELCYLLIDEIIKSDYKFEYEPSLRSNSQERIRNFSNENYRDIQNVLGFEKYDEES